MKKLLTLFSSSALAFALPVMVFAQAVADPSFSEVDTFVAELTRFINNTLIPIILAVAFLVFLYGVVQYFFVNGGDEDSRKTGRSIMLYAVFAFVIIVSIWGIVVLISNGLDLQDDSLINIPEGPDREDVLD